MHPNVLSIILYGSYARGDHDRVSDLDVCIFTKVRTSEELSKNDVKEALGHLELGKMNIVCYPEKVLDAMLAHGSLFLWHLKLEGKVLYGAQYLNDKLNGLARFKTYYDEIRYHAELFHDLKRAWELLSIVNELDLSLLFTIARNTCMVLAHKVGKASFGRLSGFYSAKEAFPELPLTIDQYLYLSKWKLLYERENNLAMPLPKKNYFSTLLFAVENCLQFAIKEVG